MLKSSKDKQMAAVRKGKNSDYTRLYNTNKR